MILILLLVCISLFNASGFGVEAFSVHHHLLRHHKRSNTLSSVHHFHKVFQITTLASKKDGDERAYDNFGLLLPIAEKLDSVSGDWALSYADLTPETPKTPAGIAFLSTNFCYVLSGIILAMKGDFIFGGFTELAGAVSFWYHYSQLEYGQNRSEVRLTLLIDYLSALTAIVIGLFYITQMGLSEIPFNAILSSGIAVGCLSLCWVWEYGVPYLFWHSLWHIFSAYTGFLIGESHIALNF